MLDTIKKERSAQLMVALFILLSFFWLFLQIFLPKTNIYYQYFAAIYGIVALLGGILGIRSAKQYGFWKSVIGKSLLMFSIGLLLQEFGQLVYSYYIYFQHIEVPYPSWGDVGYFGSIPLYCLGVIFLGKASGVAFRIKSAKYILAAVFCMGAILTFSYVLFLQNYTFDWSSPLRVFLDFGYPLGQAIYVSLAIITYLLSRGLLGGIMKNKIRFILFALVAQYIADYTFLYQNQNSLWYAGGINDYMYLIAYLLMAISLIQFKTVLDKTRESTI